LLYRLFSVSVIVLMIGTMFRALCSMLHALCPMRMSPNLLPGSQNAEPLYETSPERNSEPQNSRITNRRISKDGFARLIPF